MLPLTRQNVHLSALPLATIGPVLPPPDDPGRPGTAPQGRPSFDYGKRLRSPAADPEPVLATQLPSKLNGSISSTEEGFALSSRLRDPEHPGSTCDSRPSRAGPVSPTEQVCSHGDMPQASSPHPSSATSLTPYRLPDNVIFDEDLFACAYTDYLVAPPTWRWCPCPLHHCRLHCFASSCF